jgi:hypothetical protein
MADEGTKGIDSSLLSRCSGDGFVGHSCMIDTVFKHASAAQRNGPL